MPGVGDLRVRLGLETKRFNKSLKGIKRKLGGIQTLIAGAFAGAGIAKLVSFGRAAIDAGDKLTKLRDSLGETTEFLQFLDFAAQRSGSNLNTFATGIQRAKRRMSEFAKSGKGELAPVMGELSEEFQDAVKSGKDFEVILPILARDISSLATDGDKLRVAMKLFDSEGARPFLQFLKAGPDGVEDLKKNFIDLGGAIEEHTLDAMADMNDRFTDISFSLKRAFIPALETMLPLLESIAEILAENAPTIAEFFDFDDQAARFGPKGPQGSWWPKGTPRRPLGPGESPPRPAEQIPDWEPGDIGPEPEIPDWKPGAIGPASPWDLAALNEAASSSSALKEELAALDEKLEEIQTRAPSVAGELGAIKDSMDDQSLKVQENQMVWQLWFEDIQNLAGLASDRIFFVFQNLIDGISNAVGQAIVFQKNLGAAVVSILKSVASQVIALLVRLGIEAVIAAIITKSAEAKKASASIAGSAGRGAAAIMASSAETMGLAAIAAGPALAAAYAASTLAVAAAAIGSGVALGATVGLASGGLVTGPIMAMIGEGRESEVVAPLSKFENMLNSGDMTVVVELDGEVLAASVVDKIPGVLRFQGVGS